MPGVDRCFGNKRAQLPTQGAPTNSSSKFRRLHTKDMHMLSRLIVRSYKMLLEGAMWLILIGSFIGGWAAKGFFGSILGLLMAFVFCVVVFGAFLVLVDIQISVKAIEIRNIQ